MLAEESPRAGTFMKESKCLSLYAIAAVDEHQGLACVATFILSLPLWPLGPMRYLFRLFLRYDTSSHC